MIVFDGRPTPAWPTAPNIFAELGQMKLKIFRYTTSSRYNYRFVPFLMKSDEGERHWETAFGSVTLLPVSLVFNFKLSYFRLWQGVTCRGLSTFWRGIASDMKTNLARTERIEKNYLGQYLSHIVRTYFKVDNLIVSFKGPRERVTIIGHVLWKTDWYPWSGPSHNHGGLLKAPTCHVLLPTLPKPLSIWSWSMSSMNNSHFLLCPIPAWGKWLSYHSFTMLF